MARVDLADLKALNEQYSYVPQLTWSVGRGRSCFHASAQGLTVRLQPKPSRCTWRWKIFCEHEDCGHTAMCVLADGEVAGGVFDVAQVALLMLGAFV